MRRSDTDDGNTAEIAGNRTRTLGGGTHPQPASGWSIPVWGCHDRGILPPVCASRLPKRDNVRFFDTHEDAERAVFARANGVRRTRPPPRTHSTPRSSVVPTAS